MNNHGFRWGLIGGIGIVILDLVLYLIDSKYVLGYPSYIEWVIIFYVLYMAAMDERAEMGGYMKWGEALKPAFLAFVVSSFIYTVFLFLLFNMIDPGMAEVQKEVAMDAMDQMSGFLDEDTMETMAEAIEDQDYGFGITTASMQFVWRLIFPGFVMVAIVGLIVRKESPESLA